MNKKAKGKILTITGPSGAGRSTVVAALQRNHSDFAEPMQVTTRTQRPGEVAGERYCFVSHKDFLDGIKNEHYVFWDRHMGNYYGVRKDTIDQMLAAGKCVILECPLGIAMNATKKLYPNLISIYIIPSDTNAMVRLLVSRENNDMDRVQGRLNVYEEEAYTALKADAIVVNETSEKTAETIVRIIEDPNCAKEYYDECVEMVVQMKKALRFVKGDLQAWLKKEKGRFDFDAQMCDEDAIADSISKSNTYIQQQVSSATQLIDDATTRLRIAFGPTWEKLLPSTQTSLVSAGVLWASCAGIKDQNFDYSGICITTSCALEAAIKSVFFTGFQNYMIEKYGHPTKISSTEIYTIWPDILLDTKYGMFKKMVKDGIIPEIGLGNSFTMGTLPHLFYNKSSSVVRNRMNEYLSTILSRSDADREEYWAVNTFDQMIAGERVEDSFVSRCEQIRVAYRNPAAHSGVVQRRTALACSTEIVGREAYSCTIMSRADAFAHNSQAQGLIMKLYEFL